MTQMSNYLENALINEVMRGVAYVSPAGVYLALFSNTTDETNTPGTEYTGGSYARKLVTFGAPSDGVVANTAAVTFTNLVVGTVVDIAYFDALTGGNALFHGALTTPKTIAVSGDNLQFNIGDLTVQLR